MHLGTVNGLAARFWKKVSVTSEDACWCWTGARQTAGYGEFAAGNKTVLAHRLAYSLFYGCEIPASKVVRHLCNNPACCNPKHLALGTQADNMQDKVRSGRQVKGENIKTHKLAADDVHQIRMLLSSGMAQRQIAARFGVSQDAISKINQRKTWSWL